MADYTVSTKTADDEAVLEFDLGRENQGKESEKQITKAELLQRVVDSHIGAVRSGWERALEPIARRELKVLESELGRSRLDEIIQGTASPVPTKEERARIMNAIKKARGEK